MSRTAAAGQSQQLGITIVEKLSRPDLLLYIPCLTLQCRHHQGTIVVAMYRVTNCTYNPPALRSNSQLCEHACA